MKMKTNKFMTYALSAMMLGSLAACSSDDSEPDNGGNSGGETTDTPYVWGTEGSIKTCDHLLFNEDKSENKKGKGIIMKKKQIKNITVHVPSKCFSNNFFIGISFLLLRNFLSL